MTIKIGNKVIGPATPVYLIAEVASNHDGRLQRAKDLCYMARESGADCAKFQHFRTNTIVSPEGFAALGKAAHHKEWKSSVVDMFKQYELPWGWTRQLKEYCDSIGIEFMSTPYDLEAVDHLDPYVTAFKIGSGDITYLPLLTKVASKGKTVLLSTGASTWSEVVDATTVLEDSDCDLVLMQCTTNYSGSVDTRYLNLNVLKTYEAEFPEFTLGLSDHTGQTVAPIVAAVALGARVIERHFTDDRTRPGPDHPFAMEPHTFKAMRKLVDRADLALGSTHKFVADNEKETRVVQRRCLRATHDLPSGHVVSPEDVVALRPAPDGTLSPMELDNVIGMSLKQAVLKGEPFVRDK